MPMTSVASIQLALLKTIATHGSSGVDKSERSATAMTKNAIGTTTRFASKEIGVTRWKDQKMSGNEPSHAASETEAPPQSHSYPECTHRRGPRSRVCGRKGSGAPRRCKTLKNGSVNNTIAPTTAKESWNPVENSSFVFQQRMKKAAAARLFARETFRSKNKPPTRIEAIVAARRLATCNPVTAAEKK